MTDIYAQLSNNGFRGAQHFDAEVVTTARKIVKNESKPKLCRNCYTHSNIIA